MCIENLRPSDSLFFAHGLEGFSERQRDLSQAVQGKMLEVWIGAYVSYFRDPHTPPTLPHLTRISQIGCDSPALAVGGCDSSLTLSQ